MPRRRFSCLRNLALMAVLVLAAGKFALAEGPEEYVHWDLLGPRSESLLTLVPQIGWQTNDHEIVAGKGAKNLIGPWYGVDFEVRIAWMEPAGSDGFDLSLIRPVMEEHDFEQGSFLFRFHEGQPVAREGRDRQVSTGAIADTGQNHVAIIRRHGKQVQITVDGSMLLALELWGSGPANFVISPRGGLVLSELVWSEPRGEPLLKGDTLEGWWTPGNKDCWKVEQGELICLNKDGNYLRSEREYRDFVLSLEYKINKKGNSGIGIRTPRNGWPSGDGMELQIEDEPAGTPLTRSSTMGIYGNLEPLARADRSEEWNQVQIRAVGPEITAFVNGVLVQHADLRLLPELYRRQPAGWIGFQDHGAPVRFRNIYLHEAYAPKSDKQPGNERPSVQAQRPITWFALNRLLNPQNNLFVDRFTSHAVSARVQGAESTLLADLQGPGMLVRLARTSERGRLEFYFDGEEKPRLECAPAELMDRVVSIGEDRVPTCMLLPFAKNLRVVLHGGEPADYRLDYLAFDLTATKPDNWIPSDEWPGLASYGDGQPLVPRGMLPALSYRRQQLGWGTHREHDPLPRVRGNGSPLAAGQRATLVELDQSGVVEWFKLHADKSVLANDDLWLEMTFDGAEPPAVSAPARYIFAGLQNAENAQNFVWTYRDGFTCFLPLPFANGLRIEAVNRGQQPIAELSMTVSVDRRADQPESIPPFRLHGLFQPQATASQAALLSQAGHGQWIGFIQATPRDGSTGIALLSVDGGEQPGWASDSLDLFFGSNGQQADLRQVLCGHRGGLAWSWLHLAPVWFEKSIEMQAREGDVVGDRLALFYLHK
ncbi:MAG: family 16 glycoside hydrolase [Pirellulales bacterium]